MALIIIIENRSDLAAVSDYSYIVRVGDGTARGSREIVSGMVEKHTRADGGLRPCPCPPCQAKALVLKIAENLK